MKLAASDLEACFLDGVEEGYAQVFGARLDLAYIWLSDSEDQLTELMALRLARTLAILLNPSTESAFLSAFSLEEQPALVSRMNAMRMAASSFSAKCSSTAVGVLPPEAVEQLLGPQARAYEKMTAEFKDLMKRECRLLDGKLGGIMRRGHREIQDALLSTGVERGEALRSARSTLGEVVMDNAGEMSAMAWFLMGVTSTFLAAPLGEAVSQYQKAIDIWVADPHQGASGLGTRLARRLLAQAYASEEYWAEAFLNSRLATEGKLDWTSILESAVYSSRQQSLHDFNSLMRRLATGDTLSMLIAFCIPSVAENAAVVTDAWQRASGHVRSSTNHALARYQSILVARQQAIKSAHLADPVHHLNPEHSSEMRLKLAHAPLLELMEEEAKIALMAIEVEEQTTDMLGEEVAQRLLALDAAKLKVRQATEERDHVLRQALMERDSVFHMVNAAYALADAEGAKAERGCSLAVAFGCGTFILYIAATAVLLWRGFDAARHSTFGIVALMVAALPIGISGSVQLAQSIRRWGLDVDATKRIHQARKVYSDAVRTAEHAYSEKIETLLADQHAAEAEVARINEAKRAFVEKIHPAAATVSTRLTQSA